MTVDGERPIVVARITARLRLLDTPAPRCALPWCSRGPWHDGLCRECACRSAGVELVSRAQ